MPAAKHKEAGGERKCDEERGNELPKRDCANAQSWDAAGFFFASSAAVGSTFLSAGFCNEEERFRVENKHDIPQKPSSQSLQEKRRTARMAARSPPRPVSGFGACTASGSTCCNARPFRISASIFPRIGGRPAGRTLPPSLPPPPAASPSPRAEGRGGARGAAGGRSASSGTPREPVEGTSETGGEPSGTTEGRGGRGGRGLAPIDGPGSSARWDEGGGLR